MVRIRRGRSRQTPRLSRIRRRVAAAPFRAADYPLPSHYRSSFGVNDQHPRPGIEYPRNWHELLDWFADDEACLRYLEWLRWGQGFTCRFCDAVDGGWWQMRDGLRRCAVCRSDTSVTAGTIFAGTRTPLVSWFAAIWYVVNQKQGVSAHQSPSGPTDARTPAGRHHTNTTLHQQRSTCGLDNAAGGQARSY